VSGTMVDATGCDDVLTSVGSGLSLASSLLSWKMNSSKYSI
jgi:hypothetical protein